MWSTGPPEPPAPLPKGSAIGRCFISSQGQFLPLGLTLPTLDQTPVKCRHTGLLGIFTFSEFKQRAGWGGGGVGGWGGVGGGGC